MSFLDTAPNVLLGIPASDQDRSPTVKAFSIAMIIMPSIMVLLRLWSIVVIRSGPDVSRFWWDDWLVFLALVCPPIRKMGSANVFVLAVFYNPECFNDILDNTGFGKA